MKPRSILPIVLMSLVFPTAANAFESTMTCYPSGIYKCDNGEAARQVKWASRCIGYVVNESGTLALPNGPDGKISETTLGSITRSFETWNDVDCADIQFLHTDMTASTNVDYDSSLSCEENMNIVIWRDEDWPHDERAYALTSVTFDTNTGLIADVDIEFNGDDHTFTTTDTDGEVDVQNTLTHEVGHFFGLDHSNIVAATMFASAALGETKKRTLHEDDIEGICKIYPIEVENRVCDNPPSCLTPAPKQDEDDGCCSTVNTNRRTPVELALALLLGGVALYRRRAS